VYPADIIADLALGKCSLETKGAWCWCLFHIWRAKPETGVIEGSYPELARLWGTDVRTAKRVVRELKRNDVCSVTNGHADVTLTNRRVARRAKARNDAADRKRIERERKTSQECHGGVVAKNPLPSSSSSSSVSPLGVKTPQPPGESAECRANGNGNGARTGEGSNCKGAKTATGEFAWDMPGIRDFILSHADPLWVPELKARNKAMRKVAPDRFLGMILDVKHGDKQPGSVAEAMRWIFGRSKNHETPGDVNWENARLMMRRAVG